MIIFEETESPEMFEHALETFDNLDGVVDSLYDKTQIFKKKYHSWGTKAFKTDTNIQIDLYIHVQKKFQIHL